MYVMNDLGSVNDCILEKALNDGDDELLGVLAAGCIALQRWNKAE